MKKFLETLDGAEVAYCFSAAGDVVNAQNLLLLRARISGA